MLHEPSHHGGIPEGEDSRDSKPVGWSDLPGSLRRALSSVQKDQWDELMVTHCPSDLQKDATTLVSLFIRVWEKSRAAEDRRVDRLPGTEREKYRDDFVATLKQMASLTITLGIRAKLFGELQSEKALLTHFAQDVWQKTWTKAMARSVTEESCQSGAAPQPRGFLRNYGNPPFVRPNPEGGPKKAPSPAPAQAV
jgi:hypothetical protein